MLLTNILLGLLLAGQLFQTWVNYNGLKKRKAAPRRKKKATAQPAPAGPVKRYKAIVPGEHDRKQNHNDPD
jgi:hypothetical protein